MLNSKKLKNKTSSVTLNSVKSVVTKSLQTGLLDLQGFIGVGSDF